MLRDLTNYARALLGNWWFRGFFFLSSLSTATTFYESFHPGFLLPKNALLGVSLLALFISPYDVYKRQEVRIQALLRENAGLKDTQENRTRRCLSDLICELHDNLGKALDPVIDRSFGTGAYVRPSTDCWKTARNVLRIDNPLRDDLDRAYAAVDRWCSAVDSGLKPGMGSPELNRIVDMLRAELPKLLRELQKAQAT
jgi:hypothetical protein